MARKVCFHLVDAATRGAFMDHKKSAVSSDGVNDIDDLRKKIRINYRRNEPDILAHVVPDQLGVYANRAAYDEENAKPLDPRLSLNSLDAQDTLIVEVPTRHLIPRNVVPAAESIAIPGTTVLNEPGKYAEECISLTEWGVDAVHEIPSIWQFMNSLGGCTSNGKIFWRIEDQQVVSLLVDGWFRESSPDNINERAHKKSVLMGSPGIGKSTLLCVVVFYLVLKHKKNVLVYRRLTKLNQSNCLLYLGHQGNHVVHFSIPACTDLEARRIYAELCQQQGIENIWLLLDGLKYKHTSQELEPFNFFGNIAASGSEVSRTS